MILNIRISQLNLNHSIKGKTEIDSFDGRFILSRFGTVDLSKI